MEEAKPDERDGPRAARLPDRLTADIDQELDAELLATANTVAVSDGERPATALAWSGTLAETDLPVLLGRAYQEVWSGQLVVTRGHLETTLHFEAGRPVCATSNDPQARLGELLLRQGRIDAVERERVARLSAQSGRLTGAVLVDLGLCKPGELLPLLRSQQEGIIVSLFSWTEGTFRFDPAARLDPRRARLLRHPAALFWAALRGEYPVARLRPGLSPSAVLVLASGPGAFDLFDELTLRPEELGILGWFDGVRSVEEVIRWSGQPEALVWGLVGVLRCFGVLGPAPAGQGLGRRFLDQRVDRERIRSRLLLAQDADYFQILGVDRDASPEEVARAFRRLDEEIRPEKIAPEVAVALARELESLREILAEAARVLGDESLRQSYRRHLPPPVGAGHGPGPWSWVVIVTSLKVVFFGSPEFAVPSLRSVAARHEVALVVSQPDRPAGRGRGAGSSRGQAGGRRARSGHGPAAQDPGSRLPRPAPRNLRRRFRGGGLRPDPAARAARVAPAGLLERACLAAACLPRRGPDPVGDHARGQPDRGFDHARRGGARYRTRRRSVRGGDPRGRYRRHAGGPSFTQRGGPADGDPSL